MTENELREQSRVEELNDLAYAECKRLEELYGDFEWTECQAAYASGEWLGLVIPAIDDFAWLNDAGLDCEGESEESCSITNPDEGSPLLALVFVAWLGLRRRD